jgi:AcrR family transcriptional regulator
MWSGAMAKTSTSSKRLRPAQPAKSARGADRREKIMAEAARLFHHQGFHATGIDDIGAAVGITGPGVYRHFSSKQDLLAAIVGRVLEQHQDIAEQVKAADLEPADAMRELIRRSAESIAAEHDPSALYFQESRNLEPADLARFTKLQRDFIAEWVEMLCRARPELSREEARVAVRAVAGLLNSVAHFKSTMPPKDLGAQLAEMALSALHLS